MTIARKETVPDGIERVYHCVSRCVRRAFLCGEDRFSGKNFDHRKAWVKNRLQLLSEIFALDVAGYAVMSNHLHLVVRVRPDLASGWSEKEAALRWLRLFPPSRDDEGNPVEPASARVRALAGNAERIQTIRERLGSISWFMRCLSEFVARKANREDDCKGRFWEGRFKCQALLDEAAVLSCLAYVDLNPIRAKAAETPEKSDFTSAQDRIVSRQARRKRAEAPKMPSAAQKKLIADLHLSEARDAWLCPVEDRTDSDHRGLLPLTLDEYLELLDWTGRAIKTGKRGAIPAHLAPILQRLRIDVERWIETVESFGGWFHRVAGCVESLVTLAEDLGYNWLKGLNASRQAFAAPVG
jgi:REP element-mobilizing transposase RayT